MTEPDIIKRIQHLIPPVDDLAKALHAEHEASERIYKLMTSALAAFTVFADEVGEDIPSPSEEEALKGQERSIDAQAALISTQRVDMDAMEEFADKQAGARTIVQNFEAVFIRNDPDTILHILKVMDLKALNGAARKLEPIRRAKILDAILTGPTEPD